MANNILKKPKDNLKFIRKLGKAALHEMAHRILHDVEMKYESILSEFYDTKNFKPRIYNRTKSLYYGSSAFGKNFHPGVNIADMSNLDIKKRPLNKKGIREMGKMKLVVHVTMDGSNIQGEPYKSIYSKSNKKASKEGIFANFYNEGLHGYIIQNHNPNSAKPIIYDPTGHNTGVANADPMRPTPKNAMKSWWDKYKKNDLPKVNKEAWDAAFKRFPK